MGTFREYLGGNNINEAKKPLSNDKLRDIYKEITSMYDNYPMNTEEGLLIVYLSDLVEKIRLGHNISPILKEIKSEYTGKGINEAKWSFNDDGEVEMTKAEYKKTHSDYKGKLGDRFSVMKLDPKTGATALFPVKFVD